MIKRNRFSRGDQARHYDRATSIDSRIDTDTGEFDMVMATEGEASDGHIISMRGLEAPAELPLQLDHARSVLSNLGVVTNIRKDKLEGVPVTRGVGRIRLTGDGEGLDARRDLVDAISRGDVRGVSLTWDSVAYRERRELPRNHPAFVKRDEKDTRKRFGMFFEKARAIEQSIVAIPADREALIGRSESASDDTAREMWNSLVNRLDAAPKSRESEIIEALEATTANLEERLRAAEALLAPQSDDNPSTPAIESGIALLESQIGDWRKRTQSELDDALGEIFLRVTGRCFNETQESENLARRGKAQR